MSNQKQLHNKITETNTAVLYAAQVHKFTHDMFKKTIIRCLVLHIQLIKKNLKNLSENNRYIQRKLRIYHTEIEES